MVLPIIKKVVMFVPNKLIAINKNVNKVILPETVACQDGICAFVSAVDIGADGLQICTPGPNLTVIVTMPISVGCCKRYKLPWGSC